MNIPFPLSQAKSAKFLPKAYYPFTVNISQMPLQPIQ